MSPHSKNCLKKTASLVTHHSNVTTRCLQTTRGLHQNLSTEPLILPLQEIYPPKVTEFAYVTDGACDVATILDTELVICKVRIQVRLRYTTMRSGRLYAFFAIVLHLIKEQDLNLLDYLSWIKQACSHLNTVLLHSLLSGSELEVEPPYHHHQYLGQCVHAAV